MIFYKRNIYGKLFILRSISFVAGVFCYFSFKDGYTNLGYFLSVVLIFLSIIIIEDLVVYPDWFKVKRFYFLGLLPVKWTFCKADNVVLHSNTSGFEEEDDADGFSHFETPAGCLFYIYSLFGKKNRVTHRKFTIKKKAVAPGFRNSVEMFLSKPEYQLINEIIDHKSRLPA